MTIADDILRAKADLDDVYAAGFEKGQSQGGGGSYDQGYADGQKAEYDAFWDMFQENGNRTDYRYAFAYTKWNDDNFNPKYPLKFVGDATYAFVATEFVWADKVLRVDLSKATNLFFTFRNNKFTRLGKCDLSSATATSGTFSLLPNLVEIEEIVSHANLPWQSNTFEGTTNLESVTFSGVIGQNGLHLNYSKKLNRESIESIINALSPTTSGLSITLSKTAVINAFGNLDDEWSTVQGSKLNWTINLI